MAEQDIPAPRERRSHLDPSERGIHPNTARLREIAPRVLGAGWQYRLAQRRGMLLKTAQRWASGERIVPDEVLAELEADGEMMSASQEFQALFDAVRTLREVEFDPYILSAWLTDIANDVKPSTDAPVDKAYRRKADRKSVESPS
jgi:hypothetical protein